MLSNNSRNVHQP